MRPECGVLWLFEFSSFLVIAYYFILKEPASSKKIVKI